MSKIKSYAITTAWILVALIVAGFIDYIIGLILSIKIIWWVVFIGGNALCYYLMFRESRYYWKFRAKLNKMLEARKKAK